MIELNKIYCENCLDTMARMPDGFIDLTVTSPPYDDMDEDFNPIPQNGMRTYNGYSWDFKATAKELFRVTNLGGVVVWVIDDKKTNGAESGTSMRQALYFMNCGFYLHDKMIYESLNNAMGAKNEYLQCFEMMFVFSKGAPKTVNLLYDRKNVRNGKETALKCGRNSDGKKRRRIAVELKEFGRRKNIWQYATGGLQEVGDHPAVFPDALARDHIYSWSNEDDIVYDPFMGSGTTAKMAHIMNRRWIGSEISQEYVEIANKRLKKYITQESFDFNK